MLARQAGPTHMMRPSTAGAMPYRLVHGLQTAMWLICVPVSAAMAALCSILRFILKTTRRTCATSEVGHCYNKPIPIPGAVLF